MSTDAKVVKEHRRSSHHAVCRLTPAELVRLLDAFIATTDRSSSSSSSSSEGGSGYW